MTTEQPCRRELQAAGAHPAPCARHCEATAFHIELRRLQSENEQLRAGYDAARLEIASLQARVNECGAGAGCCAQAARIAELEAQLEAVGAGGVGPLMVLRQPECWCEDCDTAANSGLRSRMNLCQECGNKRCPRAKHHDSACTAVAKPAPQPAAQAQNISLHIAATSCPHEICSESIRLHYDSKQPGKNALAQLADRLNAAVAAQAQEDVPDMFWDADDTENFAHEIQDIIDGYGPGEIVTIECAKRLPNFRAVVTRDGDGISYEYLDAAIAAQPAAHVQHPDDDAVDKLAEAMKKKLAEKRAQGRSGWDTDCTQQRLSDLLRQHVEKGDVLDVANFCAFLFARGERVSAAQAQPAAWKMDTFQFLSDVMTAAGLVEHGKQCKALAKRLNSGVMAVRETFQAHWAPDPNQKIVKVDCGDYYQWQAAPAQAQPVCKPPKL